MKQDLNNIEDIFKNAFENFEANVDASAWANIQNNIGTSNVPTSNIGSAISSSKALLVKIVAGVVITAGVSTATYLFVNNDSVEPIQTTQTTITENNNASTEEVNISSEEKSVNSIHIKDNSEVIENSKSNKVETTISSNKNVEVKSISTNESAPISNINTTVATNKNNTTESTQKVETTQNKSNNNNEIVEFSPKLIVSVTKGKAPLDVDFDVDADAVSYNWNFGDGTVDAIIENPVHTFEKQGNYTVTLTVSDKFKRTKTIKQEIIVLNSITSKLSVVPTVFSPNGDGMNDVLKIDGEHISQFKAVVRDIKGSVVFEWDSIDGFWDGRDAHNQMVQSGSYYIVVTAVGEDGEKHLIKQSIQLFK